MIVAIKRFAVVLLHDLPTCVAPNIGILREVGVPESNIVVLLTQQPRAFMTNTDNFKKIVEEVKKMGFDPLRVKFVIAIYALRAMSKSVWKKKMEVFKKWGLSEDEVLVAFGKHPWCMITSEDKIMRVMDFFVNKMGWDSSIVAKRPVLLSLSLEKRIIPRYLVYQVLLSKGLIKKDFNLVTMLVCPEKVFLKKKFQRRNGEEQVLKVTFEGGRGRGRGTYRGRGRGRGRADFNKATVECYRCHQLGHFRYECPSGNKEANYAELDEEEEMLLMSYVELYKARREDAWFLDSGCSNHMCGDRTMFNELDEKFRHSVKLGNNTKMDVMGKGTVKLLLDGVNHVVAEVYYIPELRNNLLSIGQLQERGLAILIKGGVCKIFHPEKGLIIQTNMSANRMFILLPQSQAPSQVQSDQCFHTRTQNLFHLWHRRYGHLSYKGLRTLLYKNMFHLDQSSQQGVPESNIVVLLTYQPRAFMTNTDNFKKIVEEVKKMGFDPLRVKFVIAIHALRAMSKSVWKKKMEVFKKWGLSEDEVLVAFGKHPWCMTTSEDKIMRVMDFFVNKMGWDSSIVAKRPVLLSLSLEKRIIPRHLVYQVLLSKGKVRSFEVTQYGYEKRVLSSLFSFWQLELEAQ
ncbi:hypothetical protein F0562_034810 [Nyssa sinensis]|uniref:CCHC-type domain-containing protein n=1 Tax=Nyssa sinensis TaxID=561372 RepID=A0A5J5A8T6_9ASTE|nr:hypothetical protein F0562_034810 [Nyssa sinensis]